MATGDLEGQDASPAVGVIDSQTERPPKLERVCGCDARKKTKRRKRHILTDTVGLMPVLIIQSAGVQDRGGAPEVPGFARFRFAWLRRRRLCRPEVEEHPEELR